MFGQEAVLAPWMLFVGPLVLILLSLAAWYGGLILGTKLVRLSEAARNLSVLLVDVALLFGPFAIQELVLINNYCVLTALGFGGLLGVHLGVALAEQKVFNKLQASGSIVFRHAIIEVTTILMFVLALVFIGGNPTKQPKVSEKLCAIAAGSNVVILLLTSVFVLMISASERRKKQVTRTAIG